MSRALAAAMLAQITAGSLRPILFYQGEFTTGTLRLWSGIGTISWNGQLWTGAGTLGTVSAIEETSDIRAVGFQVSLSSQAAAILSLSLAAVRQGYLGYVWLGALDVSGAVVADPFLAFSGRLDVPEIIDEGERATITISYESRLIDLDKTRERRYTHEDQQIDYPGDLGFEYVASLQDAQITWGRGRGIPSTAPATPYGDGGGAYEVGEVGGA